MADAGAPWGQDGAASSSHDWEAGIEGDWGGDAAGTPPSGSEWAEEWGRAEGEGGAPAPSPAGAGGAPAAAGRAGGGAGGGGRRPPGGRKGVGGGAPSGGGRRPASAGPSSKRRAGGLEEKASTGGAAGGRSRPASAGPAAKAPRARAAAASARPGASQQQQPPPPTPRTPRTPRAPGAGSRPQPPQRQPQRPGSARRPQAQKTPLTPRPKSAGPSTRRPPPGQQRQGPVDPAEKAREGLCRALFTLLRACHPDPGAWFYDHDRPTGPGELREIFGGLFDRELPALPPGEAEAFFQGAGAAKLARAVRPLSKAVSPCPLGDVQVLQEILGRVLQAAEAWGGLPASGPPGGGADTEGLLARRALQASLRTVRRLERAAGLKARALRALEDEDTAAYEALWEEAEGTKSERARKVCTEAVAAACKEHDFRVWQEQKERERQDRARARSQAAREARRQAKEAREAKRAESEERYARWLESKIQGSRAAHRHFSERSSLERQEVSLRATQNRLSSDAEFDRWVKEKERQRQVLRDSREQRELEYRRTLEKRRLEELRLARVHQTREEQWA